MNWEYEQQRIYSNDENGDLIAEATFHQKKNGLIDINHTYVHPRLRRKGIAGNMMIVVAQHFREKGSQITASCPYANAWLKKHKDLYSDIISEELFSEAAACSIQGKH